MYKEVEPIIDYDVRGLCRKPYHNHPKGCPNWGKDKCPPKLPKLEDYFDVDEPIYMIWSKFDIKEHMDKMRKKHPDWTEYQLRCVLYWQGTARVQLKKEIKNFLKDHPECDVTTGPEAMGVNVTETMKKIGVILEWPPIEYSYQIAMGGTRKKENLIKSFEKFKIYEGIRWWKNGQLGEEEPFDTPIYNDILPDNGFRQFLIDNGCYEDYLKFCEIIGRSFKKKEDFKKYTRSAWTDNCFGWSNTGNRDFWAILDNKWERDMDKYPPDLNEGVRWWKDGKLGEEEPMDEIVVNEFKVGDRIMLKGLVTYWNDGKGDIGEKGKWDSHYYGDHRETVRFVDYVVNKDGYTGQVIKTEGARPWWQTTNIIKITNEGVRWWKDGKLGEEEPMEIKTDDFIPDDDFRQFLIDNNCYDKFVRNTKSKNPNFFKSSKSSWIDVSMIWCNTPEGDDYWGIIHDKWKKYCYKNKL